MIAFTSVSQGEVLTAELENPTLFVAGSAAEAARFTRWLQDDAIVRQIGEVDYETNWIVAVFRGKMGSSGYGIVIQSVKSSSGAIQLTVNLTDPAPGQAVSDVIAYPYHIILVPREAPSVTPGMTWAVYTSDGALLTQTTAIPLSGGEQR